MSNEAVGSQMGFSILPEFTEGRKLRLSLVSRTGLSSPTGRTALTCMIVKAFRPFTLSPVLLVEVALAQPSTSASPDISLPLPATAILKLYDRRCLVNTRETHDAGTPWSLNREREYRRYLDDVAARRLEASDFASPTYWADARSRAVDVSDGEFEAYLAHTARKLFEAERAAYGRLRPLQGTKIPSLYGVVEYVYKLEAVIDVPNSSSCADGFRTATTVTETIPGLLLEYVPSMTLRQLIATWTARSPPLPDAILAALCEEVVSLVDRVSDFDVLNRDVRVDNFIVREPFAVVAAASTSTSSRGESEPEPGPEPVAVQVVEDAVVLIDFGQCRLRGGDESEEEWAGAKWLQDERNAAGTVALSLVRKFVGEAAWTYRYRRDPRYSRPPEWLAAALS